MGTECELDVLFDYSYNIYLFILLKQQRRVAIKQVLSQ